MTNVNDRIKETAKEIATVFTIQELEQYVADYCSQSDLGVELPKIKEGESKFDYCQKLFASLDDDRLFSLSDYLYEQGNKVRRHPIVTETKGDQELISTLYSKMHEEKPQITAFIKPLSEIIAERFSAQALFKYFSDYCLQVNSDKSLSSIKEGENKSDYCQSLLSLFPEEELIGLLIYLVKQDQGLKQEEVIQRSLFRLVYYYGYSQTSEEQAYLSQLDRLLTPYPGSLLLWKRSISKKQSFQYQDSLKEAGACLESLLVSLFSLDVDIPLENQEETFYAWFAEKGVTDKVASLLWQTIVNHDKLQYEFTNIPFSTRLTELEVDFVLNQTYAIIKYLITFDRKPNHD